MKKLLTVLVLALALCLLCSAALAVEHHSNGVKFTYTENLGAADVLKIEADGITIDLDGVECTSIKVSLDVLPKDDPNWKDSITITHDKDHCVQDGLVFSVLYKDKDGNKYTRAYTIDKIKEYTIWDHEWKPETKKTETTGVDKCKVFKQCDCCKKWYFTGEYDHDYVDVVIEEPTCQEIGKVKRVCVRCGFEEKDKDGNVKIYDGKGGHHFFELVITPPQCNPKTKAIDLGSAYVKCTKCDTYVLEAKIEKWLEVGNKIAEIETTTDIDLAIRKNIDEAKYKALAGAEVSAHDWTDWHEIDNTCEKAGYRIRYCNRCKQDESDSYPDVPNPDPRNKPKQPKWEIVILNEKGYTCGAEYGKDYVIQCAYCNGKAKGHKIEKLDTLTEKDAYGNQYKATKKKVGNDGDSYLRIEFEVTGGVAVTLTHLESHVYKEEDQYLLYDDLAKTKLHTTQATCIANGCKFYRCVNDNVVLFADATHPTHAVVIAPKTGHNFGAWKMMEAPEVKPDGTEVPGRWVRVCTNKYCLDTDGLDHEQEELKQMNVPCDKETDHVWKTVILEAATCTKDGKEAEQCTKCLKIKDRSEKVIPAGHKYGEAKTLTAATCTEAGTAIKTCSVCGDVASDPIPATGHKLGAQVPEVKASHVKEGNKAYYQCSVCGKYFLTKEDALADKDVKAETLVIAKTADHDFTYKVETVREATCTKTGLVVKTSECGVQQNEVLPKADHEWVEVKAVEPTCTEKGKTAGKYCKNCEASEGMEAVAALGHDFTKKIEATEPTCTKAGSGEALQCSRCEEYLVKPAVIPALGHDIVKTEGKAATCTEDGITAGQKCTRCDEVTIVAEVIKAKGHTWDEGKVTKPAAEGVKGEKTYTCSACGETKKEEIPALPVPAEYDVTGIDYTNPVATGVAELKPGTDPLAKAYARVTFFLANGDCMIQIVEVEKDGSFTAGAIGNFVHISVVIVDVDDAYGADEAIEHAYGNGGIKL